MKIRAVQFSPRLADVEWNLKYHEEQALRAADDGMDLVVFPELSLTGYHLKDAVNDVLLVPGDEVFSRMCELSRGVDLVVGSPVEDPPGLIYNCALYFSEGKLLHCHRKVQLPNFGMFEERMLYAPGDTFATFRVRDLTVGMIICREILFPVHGWLYQLQNVDLLIGISNSPFRGLDSRGFSSFSLWENMGYIHSVLNNLNYLFVNRTGFEDGIGFGGGSFFAPAGKGISQKAPYMDPETMDMVLDPDAVRRSRMNGNYRRDQCPEVILKELERIIHD